MSRFTPLICRYQRVVGMWISLEAAMHVYSDHVLTIFFIQNVLHKDPQFSGIFRRVRWRD